MQPHTYCHFCGAKHVNENWPRTCGACGRITYRNPLPVVIGLVAINSPIGTGVLLVRRNIDPGLGKLALPGGYLDYGETWEQGLAREVLEETGVRLAPANFELHHIGSSTSRANLIVVGRTRNAFPRPPELDNFQPNDEVSEISIATEPIELAFPLHTEMLRHYLEAFLDPIGLL